MTIVLGLHLGHDASASLYGSAGLIGTVLQERHSQIRHDFGLSVATIDILLDRFNLTLNDIDSVGVTATQLMPALIQTPNNLAFEVSTPRLVNDDEFRAHGLHWLNEEVGLIIQKDDFSNPNKNSLDFIEQNLVANRRMPRIAFSEYEIYLIADPLFVPKTWNTPNKTLEEVVVNANKRYVGNSSQDVMGFCEDINVTIKGRVIKGHFWSHHASHAGSNASMRPNDRHIFTHDGGLGFQSGGVWLFRNGQLRLLELHELELGRIYDFFAKKIGLGVIGGAGKLMGLAAYGAGSIFPSNFFQGTPQDLVHQIEEYLNESIDKENYLVSLFDLCVEECIKLQLDVSNIGKPEFVTSQASVEIANFIQRFVENTFNELVVGVTNSLGATAIGISGGFALNCPTNSLIHDSGLFEEVIVEPHCEDGGCSVGSAYLTYSKLTIVSPPEHSRKLTTSYAYKGGVTKNVAIENSDSLDSNARLIAELISQDKVVAVLFGSSEIGPRELGHRSILANPRFLENWKRVNEIKKRESWRPFAPAVLQTSLRDFFEKGPETSPFMLFNYHVKESQRPNLLAITHCDGTSRVQTVTEFEQPLFSILTNLQKMGESPVVLNTSLNGPGQPIIEDPDSALKFFTQSSIDAILINDKLYVKNL